MDSRSKISPERAFLHDLSTPITIIKHMTKRLKDELIVLRSDTNATSVAEKMNERLEKMLAAVEQMEDLHAQRKAQISIRTN